jgi:hypothetical protein
MIPKQLKLFHEWFEQENFLNVVRNSSKSRELGEKCSNLVLMRCFRSSFDVHVRAARRTAEEIISLCSNDALLSIDFLSIRVVPGDNRFLVL